MAMICPLCNSEIQEDELGDLPLCPFCGAFVGTVEMEEETAEEETDDTEYITVCERCGHFAIMAKKDKLCAMCRGELVQIMSRRKWFDLRMNKNRRRRSGFWTSLKAASISTTPCISSTAARSVWTKMCSCTAQDAGSTPARTLRSTRTTAVPFAAWNTRRRTNSFTMSTRQSSQR